MSSEGVNFVADTKYYPDFWREYCAECKREGSMPDRAWAIFAGRFRVAGNFCGTTWFNMTQSTTRGYDAALRLLLSYAALEAACVAYPEKIENIKLEGQHLAECRRQIRRSFSSFSEKEFTLRGSLKSYNLKRKIDEFFSGQSEDLMPFAVATRSLFLHGVWTPHGSETLTKTASDGLDWISHGLKLEAQNLFVRFVRSKTNTNPRWA